MLWQWTGASDTLLAYLIRNLINIGFIPAEKYEHWKVMSFYIKQKGRQKLRKIQRHDKKDDESNPPGYQIIDNIIKELEITTGLNIK